MYSCAEDSLYHPVVIKDIQRFWKRILIVDDDVDVTVTFKVGIQDSNNSADVNKRIEVYTSNDPVLALSEFKPRTSLLRKTSITATICPSRRNSTSIRELICLFFAASCEFS